MVNKDKSKEEIQKSVKKEEAMPEVTGDKAVQPKKIMTQPLPQILDEIEDSIRKADEAAKNAREAAEEARKAGEKAANEAARVAAQAIARVEGIANKALELAELIRATLLEASDGVEKKLTSKQK
jgi:hypothetical protein